MEFHGMPRNAPPLSRVSAGSGGSDAELDCDCLQALVPPCDHD